MLLDLKAFDQKTLDRFWGYVVVGSADQCWPWVGSKGQQGYGQFWCRKTDGARIQLSSHRISHWLSTGLPVITGRAQHITHSCDRPSCCNPRHLFAGTPSSNQREAYARGLQRIVVDEALLSEALQARKTFGALAELARRRGISYGTLQSAVYKAQRRVGDNHVNGQ